jgi:hypothetical protein
VGIFDSTEEHPPHKIRRYIITGLTFVALLVLGSWYLLRFHAEKNTVRHFLDAVAAEKMEDAYRMWGKSESFSYKDFLEDWGSNSYYGPVKSYHIEGAQELKRGVEPPSGVVVTVELSPYAPFPADSDVAKQSKTKEVRLWVEFKDQSLGYAP